MGTFEALSLAWIDHQVQRKRIRSLMIESFAPALAAWPRDQRGDVPELDLGEHWWVVELLGLLDHRLGPLDRDRAAAGSLLGLRERELLPQLLDALGSPASFVPNPRDAPGPLRSLRKVGPAAR